MSENEKILVVVEPDNHPHDVVDRASWLAELSSCDLHLILCDSDASALRSGIYVSNETRDLAQQIRTAQQEMIDDIAVDARGRGINVTTDVLEERPVVVAAVDPVHSHDKPADLDQLIVKMAQAITGPVNGEVHLLHTYQRIVGIGREATKTFKPIKLPVDELSKKIQAEHREQLDKLAAANSIDAEHTATAGQHHRSVADICPGARRGCRGDGRAGPLGAQENDYRKYGREGAGPSTVRYFDRQVTRERASGRYLSG